MLVSEYFSDIGGELAQIDPPAFARPWHLLDIELAATFAKLFEFAAAYSPLDAVVQYGTQLDALIVETDRVLGEGNACPAFVVWASS
jgi:hypothetical protein